MFRDLRTWLILVSAAVVCSPHVVAAENAYQTRNVIIAVMDGVHYEQTFGDPAHALIPHLWNDLRPLGTYFTHFYNNGVTITMAGHSNIMTGTWQLLSNRGALQTRPSLIQYMADEIGLAPDEAAVIFGKGFYAYQPETSFRTYRGIYQPFFVNGIGELTYQNDYDVLDTVLGEMKKHRPRLLFVNFGVTDHSAHSGDWDFHIGAVKNADNVLFRLWNEVQNDPNYKDRTTLLITNDHGYMDEGVHDGFAEHGDNSEGSRHVMLLMLGPDIRKGHVVEGPAYHVDIAPTVGELLGFQTPLAQGVVLSEALNTFQKQNKKQARTERARRALALERLDNEKLISNLALAVLNRHKNQPKSLAPSVDSTVLFWGMLSAYDKVNDSRYLQLVTDWRDAWEAAGRADDPHVAFVDAELCFRLKDQGLRSVRVPRLQKLATRILDEYTPKLASVERGDKQFLLSLIMVAAVSELAHDEPLWQRAADLYVAHVQGIDYREAAIRETALSQVSMHAARQTGAGEVIDETGKVLPEISHKPAGPHEAWYLLAASFIRSHGLPFKGENLPDLNFFAPEVLYRTFLMLERTEQAFPGELWADPTDSALAVAAIREVRRRVTLAGDLYGRASTLSQPELNAIRPKSAQDMPEVDTVKELLRHRVARMNYNVNYGLPRYQAFDFMVDVLRLRVSESKNDLTTGLFLLALDENRRVPLEPLAPTPRGSGINLPGERLW